MSGTPALPDFWLSSGYRLLRCDAEGRLMVTDAFLRAYLHRLEMRPVAESCAAERALHDALLSHPRRRVEEAALAALADADAADNYRQWLRFRDRLLAAGTLEAAYLALFRGGIDVAPLFVDHLAHAILRGVLDDCEDPLALRAAELLFRTQKVSIAQGAIMLADEEAVESEADTALDVLGEANAALYWERSDRFDTVLDLTFGRPGLDALCRVLERWVAHFLGTRVHVEPVQAIRDERWSWHVGLDGEASAILNDLYRGAEVVEDRLSRLLSLFRLSFADPAVMLPHLAGRPVYLGLAMDADRRLRVKPQNLLVNLPLSSAGAGRAM